MTLELKIAFIGAAASVVSAMIAAIQLLKSERPKNVTTSGVFRREFFKWLPAIVAVSAVAIDFYDKHGPVNCESAIGTYGYDPRTTLLVADINSGLLTDFAAEYKMILVGQMPYADIDQETDTAIAKSREYTITGQPVAMSFSIDYQTKLRVKKSSPNILFFRLFLLPKSVSPDSITSFSDVPILGGKFIAQKGLNLGPIPWLEIQAAPK
jgi:hypothetical protein